MNVLVVDNSRTHIFVVSQFLEEAGHEVLVARDGPEALDILSSQSVQMLIIGWVLPSMEGTELVRQIRQDFAKPYRYIIMATAKSGQEHLMTGLHSGIDDYMEKPVNQAELQARMKIGERIIELEANLQKTLQEVQQAHKRSEELLLNVLPEPVAMRMKAGEVNIAESFEDVTVMFADLVGFTSLTATTPPIEFIDLLNGIFSTFDHLTEQYGLEKIKTIGDSYLVVAGVPLPKENHAQVIATMALNMMSEISNINEIGGYSLQLRIGIDSGSVIAGVIGQQKFTYDLWGDTVNTASRMESSGEPGRIQVTQNVYELLKDDFCLEKRGELAIKGKGQMVTYWLMGKQA